jgi:hypothetical protein
VVAVVLGYCGFALLAPLAVALAALVARPLAVALRTRGHAAADRLPGRARPGRPAVTRRTVRAVARRTMRAVTRRTVRAVARRS